MWLSGEEEEGGSKPEDSADGQPRLLYVFQLPPCLEMRKPGQDGPGLLPTELGPCYPVGGNSTEEFEWVCTIGGFGDCWRRGWTREGLLQGMAAPHQFSFSFFNVYLFLRDRVRAGEGQRERETQNLSRSPALSSQHRARHGAPTHKPRDQDLSRSLTSDRLNPPGAPPTNFLMDPHPYPQPNLTVGGAEMKGLVAGSACSNH